MNCVVPLIARKASPTLLEIDGYASLFGVPDLERDVVRRGAFRDSIAARPSLPMLVRHDRRLVAGRWTELVEDARGLRVRGSIEADACAADLAMRAIAEGVDGLSIGFVTRAARVLADGGRELASIDRAHDSLPCRERKQHESGNQNGRRAAGCAVARIPRVQGRQRPAARRDRGETP
jgi:HK97 family phage prohead protease